MNKYTKNYGRTIAQQYLKEHKAEKAVEQLLKTEQMLEDMLNLCIECGRNPCLNNCIRFN